MTPFVRPRSAAWRALQARATNRHRLPGVVAVFSAKTNWRAMTAI
jgi:hypothetical protein